MRGMDSELGMLQASCVGWYVFLCCAFIVVWQHTLART